MRSLQIKCLLAGIFLLTLLPFSSLYAQPDSVNAAGQIRAITTAVPFLLISPDSRSGAMGETGVAIADNAYAVHWNNSALAFSEKKMGFSLNYSPWLRQLVPDINLGYVSGYFNLGERKGVVSSSLRYFSLGNIMLTNESGDNVGEFNANEIAVDMGYARRITDNFSAGVALRYIYSNLAAAGSIGGIGETKPGMSVAGDLNMLYSKDFAIKTGGKELPLTFNWGLNISNIGAKISYTNSANQDFIPTNLKTGFMVRTGLDEFNSLAFTMDVNKLMVPSEGGQSDKALLEGIFTSFGDAEGGFKEEMSEFNVGMGLEYWYNNLIAVRAGMFLEDKSKGNRKFITLGAGVRYKVFQIDFAYLTALTQNHPLQNTLRFSLAFDLDPVQNQ